MKMRLRHRLLSGLRELEFKITEASFKKALTTSTAEHPSRVRFQRTSNAESDSAAEDLKRFLQRLKEPAACDVVMQVKAAVDCIYRMSRNGSVDDISDVVQDFFENMYHRFNEHPLYKGLSPPGVYLLMTLVERYLMTLSYADVFESILRENEEDDLAVNQRIREHSWVTTKHLELDIDEENPSVRRAMDLAITEIKGLENKESPDAKLECVMRCSKLLCHALLIGKKDPGLVSADDLLPATVWMLLRANPHFLHSNIKYVTRFGAPDKVYAGETGYYFANLCSATSFIKTLTEDSFHVPVNGKDDSR